MIHRHKVINAATRISEYDVFEWCDFSQGPQNVKGKIVTLKDIKNVTLRNCYIKDLRVPNQAVIEDCYKEVTGYRNHYRYGPLPDVEKPVFWKCNLSRQVVEKIYETTKATFYECNLANCELRNETKHIRVNCNNHR